MSTTGSPLSNSRLRASLTVGETIPLPYSALLNDTKLTPLTTREAHSRLPGSPDSVNRLRLPAVSLSYVLSAFSYS